MTKLSPYIAARVCAWCKKPMGTYETTADLDGMQSHGICPECEQTAFADVDKIQVQPALKSQDAHPAHIPVSV